MFNPKRVIPKLAVAALALTGCGETDAPEGFFGTGGTAGTGGSGGTVGTGGTPGTGGSGGTNGTLAGSLEAFCMKLVECFPNSPYYNTTEECITGITTYYGLGGEISNECEAAAISYFQCGAPLTCPEFTMETNSCSDEGEAAERECS